MVLTMEEMTYNYLNLRKTGLVIFVNAMSCKFFQESIIPTKQNVCKNTTSISFKGTMSQENSRLLSNLNFWDLSILKTESC